MKKIVIATHGYMARGIKSTLEIISGSVDNIIDINAFTEECPNPEPVVEELLARYKDEELLILTDIYFGGVNQIFLRARRERKFQLVTGINLPAAMELFHYIGQDLTDEQIEAVIAMCQEELKLIREEPDRTETFCDELEEL